MPFRSFTRRRVSPSALKMKELAIMKDQARNFGNTLLGCMLVILSVTAFIMLIIGGAALFETLYPILEKISSFTWAIIWLLLPISLIPQLRNFTGGGIVLGTYIVGAILWLFCFFVTFQLWGVLGIIIGVLFLGLGVFFTALLALLFDGQFMSALTLGLVLIQIFIFRFLGFWIMSKYKTSTDNAPRYDKSIEGDTTTQTSDEIRRH